MNSLILLLTSLSCSVSSPTQAPHEDAPAVASPVDARQPVKPSIEGIDIEGVETLLATPADRTRVVNFWATWCGPCVAELPMLRELATARPDIEVVLVSLDIQSVRAKRVLPFLAKYELGGLTNYHLEDPDPAMAMGRIPGWPASIPVTFIVDREGRTVKRFDKAVKRQVLEGALDAME